MKTICICDDDQGIVDVLQIILQSSGYTTVVLVNTDDIVSQIESVNPDLLLLDLWMPTLDGSEITRRLRRNPATAHLPIIVISASHQTVKITKEIGATDYLLKPFDIDQITKIITKYTSAT